MVIDSNAGTSGVLLQSPLVSASTVTLQWTPASGATDYLLEAGSASGLSNLYNASVGRITMLSATAPAGTYYVRVRARTAAGIGPVSDEVSFSVGPGGCTLAPPAPTGLTASVVAGVASVRWNAAPAASSYIVRAGPVAGSSSFFDGDVGPSLSVSSPVAAGFRA